MSKIYLIINFRNFQKTIKKIKYYVTGIWLRILLKKEINIEKIYSKKLLASWF